MKNKYQIFAALGVVIVIAVILFYPKQGKTNELDSFARCLAKKKVTMYGAKWCSHCQNEKKAFGESFRLVPYVECPTNPQKCLAAKVDGYPTWIFPDGRKLEGEQGLQKLSNESGCVLPEDAVNLPISFGNLGQELVKLGVIDPQKMESKFLNWHHSRLVINEQNANEALNLLWGFGLANKNEVLETGPMMDPQYGGPDNFASVGGWTLGTGQPMDHYSHHNLVKLGDKEQDRVNTVAKKIFRPCCDNSTYFPDCNHGMAMLGLLELLAAKDLSSQDMEKYAHQVNKLWFPELRQNYSCAA